MRFISFILITIFASLGSQAGAAILPRDIKGDWKGSVNVPGSPYNYAVVLHIIDSNKILQGTLRFQVTQKISIVTAVSATITSDSVYKLTTGEIMNAQDIPGSIKASYHPFVFAVSISITELSMVARGNWQTKNGTMDMPGSYEDLLSCKNGQISFRRAKSASELLAFIIDTQIAIARKQGTYELDAEYAKRVSGSMFKALQDSIATAFYTKYLSVQSPRSIYDRKNGGFLVTIDGCANIFFKIDATYADCFKNVFDNRSYVIKNLSLTWGDTSNTSTITNFVVQVTCTAGTTKVTHSFISMQPPTK